MIAGILLGGIAQRHGRQIRGFLARETGDRRVRLPQHLAGEILDAVDLEPIYSAMPDHAAAALFCVERDAAACHRSLVAQRFAEEFGVPVTHLLP